MNRGRSDDSLDNVMNDMVSSGSSSPTNFTSDDEAGEVGEFICPLNPELRARIDTLSPRRQDTKISSNANPFSDRIQRAIQTASNLRPTTSSHSGHQSGHTANDTAIPSTSFYNKNEISRNIDVRSSRMPDVLSDASTTPLLSDEIYGRGYNDRLMYNPAGFSSSHCQQFAGNGGIANLESYGSIGDRDIYLGENPSIEHAAQVMASPSGGLGTLTARMCARLVECRALTEAIEFIDCNREAIENMTRIVTRDAPAFCDYDMSNYQIDHSVKESFNPNFWLDREPVITTADGNCQYHAVSISLTGSEDYTQEVRLATAVAVVDNRDWFDSMLELIDRGTVLDLVHTIARSFSWGDETTLKAIAVAIKRRIFLYTCNIGKKDYEMVKSLSKEELLDAFKEKKYRGGTGIHTYADPLTHVPANNYIMLFHKSEHFIAVLPTSQQPTMFEPYNPIVPTFC